MRRGAAAVLLAALVLSGCGAGTRAAGEPWEITMEEVAAANRTAVLLERYGSIWEQTRDQWSDEGSAYCADTYLDRDLYYTADCCLDGDAAYDTVEQIVVPASGRVYFRQDGVCVARLDGREEDGQPSFDPADYELDEAYLRAETVLSAVRAGDRILLTTRIGEADLLALDGWYDEPDNGNYQVTEYVLNAEDAAILSYTSVYYDVESGAQDRFQSTVTLGGDRPADIGELYGHAVSGDTCTLTVVLDPGTEDERTCAVAVTRGDPAEVSLPQAYREDGTEVLYTDPACTVRRPEGDGVLYGFDHDALSEYPEDLRRGLYADLTLYARKTKQSTMDDLIPNLTQEDV